MDVQFNEPNVTPSQGARGPRASFLTRLVLKMGIVKTDREAQWVLLFIAILAAVLTVALVPFAMQKPPAPPTELIRTP